MPLSLQIGCSFPDGTGRAPLLGGASDLLQGRQGRSERPPSTCCFYDLLQGREFMTPEFLGGCAFRQKVILGTQMPSAQINLMSKWLTSRCHILIPCKLHTFPTNDFYH